LLAGVFFYRLSISEQNDVGVKMFSTLGAIVALIGALFGGVHHTEPVQAERPAEAVVEARWVDDPANTSKWLKQTMKQSGLIIPKHITVIFTDVDNCGSELSPGGTGGGCTIRFSDKTISVLVSPTAIETGTAEHILFHELGHAMANLGECGAEYYAHYFSNPNQWSYPECMQ
jgi:hypothetical protein